MNVKGIALRSLNLQGTKIIAGNQYEIQECEVGVYQGRRTLCVYLKIQNENSTTLVMVPKEWVDIGGKGLTCSTN